MRTPLTNFDIHVFRTRDDLWCARIEGLGEGRLYTRRHMSLKDVLFDVEVLVSRLSPASHNISGSPELDPRTERGLK